MIIKNNKILKVSAIATILSIGLLSAGYTLANKNITLVVKGKETEISTLKSNVEDVLAEQNVKYDKNDIISLPLDQKISDGDKIAPFTPYTTPDVPAVEAISPGLNTFRERALLGWSPAR